MVSVAGWLSPRKKALVNRRGRVFPLGASCPDSPRVPSARSSPDELSSFPALDMSPSFRPSLLAKPAGSAAASSCLHTPKRLSHVLLVTTTRSVQTFNPKTLPHASCARPDGPNGPHGQRGARSPSSRATCTSHAHLCHVRRWNSWSPKVSGDAVPALRRGADSNPSATRVDAVVIGAGQAGLSVAYHLQKAGGFRFVTLDANQVSPSSTNFFSLSPFPNNECTSAFKVCCSQRGGALFSCLTWVVG